VPPAPRFIILLKMSTVKCRCTICPLHYLLNFSENNLVHWTPDNNLIPHYLIFSNSRWLFHFQIISTTFLNLAPVMKIKKYLTPKKKPPAFFDFADSDERAKDGQAVQRLEDSLGNQPTNCTDIPFGFGASMCHSVKPNSRLICKEQSRRTRIWVINHLQAYKQINADKIKARIKWKRSKIVGRAIQNAWSHCSSHTRKAVMHGIKQKPKPKPLFKIVKVGMVQRV
jgi:hypothetical protein